MGIFSHHKIYNSCTYETLIKKIHDDRKLYIYSVMLLNKFTCESEYYIVLKDSGIYGKILAYQFLLNLKFGGCIHIADPLQ